MRRCLKNTYPQPTEKSSEIHSPVKKNHPTDPATESSQTSAVLFPGVSSTAPQPTKVISEVLGVSGSKLSPSDMGVSGDWPKDPVCGNTPPEEEPHERDQEEAPGSQSIGLTTALSLFEIGPMEKRDVSEKGPIPLACGVRVAEDSGDEKPGDYTRNTPYTPPHLVGGRPGEDVFCHRCNRGKDNPEEAVLLIRVFRGGQLEWECPPSLLKDCQWKVEEPKHPQERLMIAGVLPSCNPDRR